MINAYPLTFDELENNISDMHYDIYYIYQNDDWLKYLFYYNNGIYDTMEVYKVLFNLYGNREVIIPKKMYKVTYANDSEYLAKVAEYIGKQIQSLFLLNRYKYQKIYDALTAVYNPLWNVDGTETRTITETQKGYKQNEKKTTGKYQEETSIEYNGEEKMQHGGYDEIQKSGTRDMSKTGQRDLTKSGDEVRQTVPMENSTFYDTEKTHYNDVKESETFTNYKESESFTQYSDKTNYKSNDTKSFTNRKDTTTHKVDYTDPNILTDTIKESVSNDYEHKTIDELVRGGNIGVTKSTELVESETILRLENDFRNMVYSDIANCILYMC